MIELKDLQKVIGQQTVLDIPTLTIRAGEVAALVGTAGSGQESLLALLTGKMQPTLGSLRLAEIDPASEREAFSRKAGVLFSQDGLYLRESVQANLGFYAHLYGLPERRVTQVLVEAGLQDHAQLAANKLSSGLRRRLAFGRAILHQPVILILEEPFEHCDEASIALLKRLIRQAAGAGTAVLILDHDSTHLVDLCDTLYSLENGRIKEISHPKEAPADSPPFKVPVRLEGKVTLVNPADIFYADASEGKAILYTASERLPTQFTLTELENRLQRSGFFRAHRSYLVNLQHIKEVIPYTRDSFSLRLDNTAGTIIPLSKQAAGELKDLFGY